MAGHFGYMQGDFLAVGTAQKEGIDLLFDEARIEVVEDGKAIHIYGFLADSTVNSKHELKTKDEEGKWINSDCRLIKVEIVTETIEKDYNGKVSKKEPTVVGEFIANELKAACDPNKFYKLFINLGAPASYPNSITTGKTEKGTAIPDSMIDEFKAELFTIEEIEDAPNLSSAKAPEKKTFNKRVSADVVILEKVKGVSELIRSDETAAQLQEIILFCDSHHSSDTALAVIAALLS